MAESCNQRPTLTGNSRNTSNSADIELCVLDKENVGEGRNL